MEWGGHGVVMGWGGHDHGVGGGHGMVVKGKKTIIFKIPKFCLFVFWLLLYSGIFTSVCWFVPSVL